MGKLYACMVISPVQSNAFLFSHYFSKECVTEKKMKMVSMQSVVMVVVVVAMYGGVAQGFSMGGKDPVTLPGKRIPNKFINNKVTVTKACKCMSLQHQVSK